MPSALTLDACLFLDYVCVCVLGGVNLVDVGFGIGFIYKAGREPFSVYV